MKKPILIAEDVCHITPEVLRGRGIRAVLSDLDNTLTGYGVAVPDEAVMGWIKNLEAAGIPLFIVSNASKERVEAFCGPLGLPFTARAGKPRARRLLEALANLGVNASDAVMVGDQYFTDGKSGHNAGIRIILVPPRVKGFLFALRRQFEKPFIRRSIERL